MRIIFLIAFLKILVLIATRGAILSLLETIRKKK